MKNRFLKIFLVFILSILILFILFFGGCLALVASIYTLGTSILFLGSVIAFLVLIILKILTENNYEIKERKITVTMGFSFFSMIQIMLIIWLLASLLFNINHYDACIKLFGLGLVIVSLIFSIRRYIKLLKEINSNEHGE